MLIGDVIMEHPFSNRRLLWLEPADWALFFSGIALAAALVLLA